MEACPVCGASVALPDIEQHVNRCLDADSPSTTGTTGSRGNSSSSSSSSSTTTTTSTSTGQPTPSASATGSPTLLADISPSAVALLAEVEELRKALHQRDLENQKLKEELKGLQLSLFRSEETRKLLQQEIVAHGVSSALVSTEDDGDVLATAYRLQAQRAQRQKEAEQFAIMIDVVEKWKAFARARLEAQESQRLIERMLQEDKRLREEELENKRYDCSICFSDYKLDEIYVLDACSHRFCRDCLEEYLKVKIGEGTAAVKKINCPSASCKGELTYTEIKQLLDKESFAKYERFNLEAALEAIPDLRWCPKADCQNAMIGDPKRPMMVCTSQKCRYTFCFNCKEEWHADATCEQYQKWKVENSEAEARYQDWVKQHARPCPSCHSPIEKNGGCNHMTCKKCNHQYCWLCMQEYKAGHFNEEGPCKGKQFT